jgi:hypothetical protein
MKAKELIELLKTADPESEVSFQVYEGCCGDTRDLDIQDAEVVHLTGSTVCKDEHFLQVVFSKLPGYYSCIQSGATKRAHNEYWEAHGKPGYKV